MNTSDPSRSWFLRSLELFDERVEATPPDRWSDPSPCEGWTARDVVAHAAGNLRALRGILGGDAAAAFGQPVEGDIIAAWGDARDGAAQALAAAATGASETVVVRERTMPLASLLDSLMRDLVIHSWDLARAVGGDARIPDDLVTAATTAMAAVTDRQRVPGLYGAIVDVPSEADAQTRLLALSGRST